MRNVTIATINNKGIAETAMVWFDETDNSTVVQLSINGHKYNFDNNGKIQQISEIQSCVNLSLSSYARCAEIMQSTCMPITIKTED